jgi:NADPH:quinone reductase-like Zn-dependent oxidoreductase
MKAIRYYQYGSPDVLQLVEAEMPAITDDRVLVRVRAASPNPYDWHFMRGKPWLMRLQTGLLKPKDNRLGVDFAGVVETVGKNITQFRPGDEVFGGVGGAFAEYASVSEQSLAPKPTNLTFEQAASVPMVGYTALQALRDNGQLQPGQKVLINGASGGVGTFAVQIAKSFGAEVTGVCSSANVDMVRSIGADHVIDYNREDFTRSGLHYDLMLDIVGNRALSECRGVLSPGGRYVVIGGDGDRGGVLIRLLKVVVYSRFVSHEMTAMMAKPRQQDLLFLKNLVESEKLTPVIDRHYSLSEIPEAVRYLETKRARGKIAITV